MKRILAAMTAALMMVALVSSTVFAVAPTSNLMGQAWKVYNVKPATSSFWDINKVKLDAEGILTFPIQQFDTTSTGSFAVYLLNNYNKDITGQTFSAEAYWTIGEYKTRSTVFPGAYVRFEFQDVAAGSYNSNDYWWSTGTNSLDLNVGWGGTLTASLSDCTLWSNQSGKSACDTTQDWTEWQGDVVHASPAEGFANAMKNVKQLGLSFGSSGSYASGVALVGDSGVFRVVAFDLTP
jgi:hypothetical protein